MIFKKKQKMPQHNMILNIGEKYAVKDEGKIVPAKLMEIGSEIIRFGFYKFGTYYGDAFEPIEPKLVPNCDIVEEWVKYKESKYELRNT